jgi:hypothetical protein
MLSICIKNNPIPKNDKEYKTLMVMGLMKLEKKENNKIKDSTDCGTCN